MNVNDETQNEDIDTVEADWAYLRGELERLARLACEWAAFSPVALTDAQEELLDRLIATASLTGRACGEELCLCDPACPPTAAGAS